MRVDDRSPSPSSPARAPDDNAPGPQAKRAASRVAAGVFEGESEDDESTWTESITGTVTDVEGRPIAGAVVVSHNSVRNFGRRLRASSSADVGRAYRGFGSLEDDLAANAETQVDLRRRTRTAEVDSEGRFELEGLKPGTHTLRGYAEGYTFASVSADVGSLAQVIGIPVNEFELDLRLPDGTQPDEGFIELKGRNNSRDQFFEWSPDATTVRTSSQTIEFQAYAGDVRYLRNRETLADTTSRTMSLDIGRDGAGPHRVELIPAKFLRVRVVDESKVVPVLEPWVRALPAADAGEGDDAWSSNTVVDLEREARDVFTMKDLAEGEWIVAAGRGTREPETTTSIVVGSGATEVEIALPEVDLSKFIVVRAKVPGGRPALNLGFTVAVVYTAGHHNSLGLQSMDRGMGVYWLSKPNLERYGSPENIEELRLTATSPHFGSVVQPYDLGTDELELVFAPASEVHVSLRGDVSEAYTVALSRLTGEDDESSRPFGGYMRQGQLSKQVDADGRALFTGIQPGRYSITVTKSGQGRSRRWNWTHASIIEEETVVRSGSNEVTLALPALHDVAVRAPELTENATMILAPADGFDPANPWAAPSTRRTNLDADLTGTFEDVPAGTYVLLSYNAQGSHTTVTVPTGVVTFEVKKVDSLIVSNVQAGKHAAEAGLQNGDLVTAIDGEAVSGPSSQQLFMMRIIADDVELEVERGGSKLSITVSKIAGGQAAYQALGMGLMPHVR